MQPVIKRKSGNEACTTTSQRPQPPESVQEPWPRPGPVISSGSAWQRLPSWRWEWRLSGSCRSAPVRAAEKISPDVVTIRDQLTLYGRPMLRCSRGTIARSPAGAGENDAGPVTAPCRRRPGLPLGRPCGRSHYPPCAAGRPRGTRHTLSIVIELVRYPVRTELVSGRSGKAVPEFSGSLPIAGEE